jgi:hypothetical protein
VDNAAAALHVRFRGESFSAFAARFKSNFPQIGIRFAWQFSFFHFAICFSRWTKRQKRGSRNLKTEIERNGVNFAANQK